MGYIECIEMAGAEVLGYKFAGSYQGTWGAVVVYEGKRQLVTGAYGSCSGCDAFEAEFGWNEPQCCHDPESGKYYNSTYDFSHENEISEEEYKRMQEEHRQRLANFGKSYLHGLWDKTDIENKLKNFNPDSWYDDEEKELLEWALPYFDPKEN